jgi:hypothetical protein
LLDPQVSWLCTLEELVDIARSAPIEVHKVRTVCAPSDGIFNRFRRPHLGNAFRSGGGRLSQRGLGSADIARRLNCSDRPQLAAGELPVFEGVPCQRSCCFAHVR